MILKLFSLIVLCVSLYFFLFALLNILWIKRHTKKPLFQGGPSVSVLVPARNEEKNIEACVRSLMLQNYENYEVIVLDDNSEDKTFEIIEKLGKEYPRKLKILQGVPLEDGWKGKPFAMSQLTSFAAGDILICTDADTVHSPESISWAVTNMVCSDADMISGYVKQNLESFGEKIVVPLIFILTGFALPVFLSRRIKSCVLAAAIGQFIAIRADSLKKVGGYAAIRNKTSDDIYLARTMRQFSFSTFFLDAKKVVTCRMYSSYKAALDGVSKNITDFFTNNIFVVLTIMIGVFLFLFLPFPLGLFLFFTGNVHADNLLLGSLFYFFTWFAICVNQKIPCYIAFLYPVLFFNLITLAFVSVVRQHTKKGFHWKGRVVK